MATTVSSSSSSSSPYFSEAVALSSKSTSILKSIPGKSSFQKASSEKAAIAYLYSCSTSSIVSTFFSFFGHSISGSALIFPSRCPLSRIRRRGSFSGDFCPVRDLDPTTRKGAYNRLMTNYFNGPASVYDDTDFERRFRMSRRLFNGIHSMVVGRDPFIHKKDALGRLGIYPLTRKHYHLIFLNDCLDLLNANIPVGRVDQMHYGLIDQLVASRGRYFLGAWFSTFTAYINRIRGYHSNRYRVEGFEQGAIPSWTYMLPDQYDYMREYYPLKRIFWAREFPAAWRLIDTGMEEYHKELFEDEHSIRSAFR